MVVVTFCQSVSVVVLVVFCCRSGPMVVVTFCQSVSVVVLVLFCCRSGSMLDMLLWEWVRGCTDILYRPMVVLMSCSGSGSIFCIDIGMGP